MNKSTLVPPTAESAQMFEQCWRPFRKGILVLVVLSVVFFATYAAFYHSCFSKGAARATVDQSYALKSHGSTVYVRTATGERLRWMETVLVVLIPSALILAMTGKVLMRFALVLRLRLPAVVGLRCPRCMKGRVYKGIIRIHERCQDCDLEFNRSHGYFIGAMYFGYFLLVLTGSPLYLMLLYCDVDEVTRQLSMLAFGVLMVPFVMRYAKVMWLHFDQLMSPR